MCDTIINIITRKSFKLRAQVTGRHVYISKGREGKKSAYKWWTWYKDLLLQQLPSAPVLLLHQSTAPTEQTNNLDHMIEEYGQSSSEYRWVHMSPQCFTPFILNSLYWSCVLSIKASSSFSSLLVSARCGALYLFGSGGHVDDILNAVVKEVPGVLEVWRGILNHHQLCGVIDARQCCPFSVPVHLQKKGVAPKVHMVIFKRCNFNLSVS